MSVEMECSHPATVACLVFQEALRNDREDRGEDEREKGSVSRSAVCGCIAVICSLGNLWKNKDTYRALWLYF